MPQLSLPLVADQHGARLQAALLPIETTKTAFASISGSSAGGAIPQAVSGTNTVLIRVASTGTCHIKVGTGAQTATTSDPLFPAGAEVFALPDGVTHFAVIQSGGSTGSVSVTAIA